jgi:hypothetical protein
MAAETLNVRLFSFVKLVPFLLLGQR